MIHVVDLWSFVQGDNIYDDTKHQPLSEKGYGYTFRADNTKQQL